MGAVTAGKLCFALLIIALLTVFAIMGARSSGHPSVRDGFNTDSASEESERILIPYVGTEPINDIGSGAVAWADSAYAMGEPRPNPLANSKNLLAREYARAYPPEPTVRDGTVAPIAASEPPAMVQRGLHADSGGIAEYMAEGTSRPEIGIARVGWFRAMDDAARGAAARGRKPLVQFELLPGEAGSLVPESSRGDRPLGMPRAHMLAGYADGGDSAPGYNSRFIPDGPWIE